MYKANKIVYLGLADGTIFTANNAQSGGKFYLPGISELYTGNGANKVWHAGNDGSGSGLDADLLDGLHLNSSTRNNEANKVMRTDASGYANFGWINTTSGIASGTISRIYCSHDGYIRYLAPADVSVGYATSAGNAETVDTYHIVVCSSSAYERSSKDSKTIYFVY